MDSNLFWCIVGIAGGAIISFLISYFFYFRGLTRKCLTYDIKTFSIISNKINQIEDLEVKYDSKEIDNLYSSTIIIRNIGNSIVKQQDVAPLCPILLSTSGRFLKSKNEYIESHPVSKVSDYVLLHSSNNHINFKFDYIPKKAIITFSLFHTGNITFKGDLMDGKIITPSQNQKKSKIIHFIILFFVMLFGCILGNISAHFF